MIPPSKLSFIARLAQPLAADELADPNLQTIVKFIRETLRGFVIERPGLIIGSTFLLIMVWGSHGKVDLLHLIWPDYRGPGVDIGTRPVIIPGIPWDNELISWIIGAALLLLIPIILIQRVYKQPLHDFGLGLPPANRRRLAVRGFVALTVLSLIAFVPGAQVKSMQDVYPFFKNFTSFGQFLAYEVCYFIFFLVIEFTFRGYLLFGLAGVRDSDVAGGSGGAPGVFYWGRYAIMIQMLSYTAWHLGKPVPELWGTVVWGLVAGALTYGVRSIWPVTLAHWTLNIVLDFLILRALGIL